MLSRVAPERVALLETAGFSWASWKRCFVHNESRVLVAFEEVRDLSEAAFQQLVAFRCPPSAT